MSRLPEIIAARRANAAALSEGLAEIEGLVLPLEPEHRTHVFHQYTVRVTEQARRSRDEVLTALRDRGVDAGVYYPAAVWDHACFRDDPRIGTPRTPVTDRVARQVLSLPVHPKVDRADLEHIVEVVRGVLA
jgi:dTDP-4-amino-4,6-dideoxygalactose transaminase